MIIMYKRRAVKPARLFFEQNFKVLHFYFVLIYAIKKSGISRTFLLEHGAQIHLNQYPLGRGV